MPGVDLSVHPVRTTVLYLITGTKKMKSVDSQLLSRNCNRLGGRVFLHEPYFQRSNSVSAARITDCSNISSSIGSMS